MKFAQSNEHTVGQNLEHLEFDTPKKDKLRIMPVSDSPWAPTGFGTKLTEGKEAREFDGRQCVLETALTADFALMRADVADRWGNVSFRGTQSNFGPAMAMASRVAVVEVERISEEPLPPSTIDIPGIFTQRIIAVADER